MSMNITPQTIEMIVDDRRTNAMARAAQRRTSRGRPWRRRQDPVRCT